MQNLWEVHVKGKKCSTSFEISVIRKNDVHGHESWSWLGSDTKLLICEGRDAGLIELVWDKMIVLAEETAAELNDKERKQMENYLQRLTNGELI